MSDINYVVGDATRPIGDGSKIICHICNDVGAWGAGFVVALSRRWPQPETAYREWHRDGDGFRLGEIQLVPVAHDITVANMIGQHDVRRVGSNAPIRYEAVETCLGKVAAVAAHIGATVHMPRIGCGLAGGKWGMIEPIIRQTLCKQGINVLVYDWNN